MEQFYHMFEILQSLKLAAFPVMQCYVKITTNNNRKVIEKYSFGAGKSLKNP